MYALVCIFVCKGICCQVSFCLCLLSAGIIGFYPYSQCFFMWVLGMELRFLCCRHKRSVDWTIFLVPEKRISRNHPCSLLVRGTCFPGLTGQSCFQEEGPVLAHGLSDCQSIKVNLVSAWWHGLAVAAFHILVAQKPERLGLKPEVNYSKNVL